MMIEFDEYKVKLNGLKPKLDELAASLGIERCKEDIERLHAQIESPGFWDNAEVSQKVMKQARQVEAKVERYEKMRSHWEDLMTICEMAIEENDDSMLEELKEGYTALEEEMERERLETLLSGEYDGNNAIVSFQAGAGGTEAQDWAQMLYRMYTHWVEGHGLSYKILDYLDGDEAGIKSASILVEGTNAYGLLKSENGVHRLVRVSPFDANARRQTSFAAVEVIPEIADDTKDVDIRPEDIEMQVYRSSGAGGQHINKTSSAVRLIHKPTGIVVSCQTQRSRSSGAARSATTSSCPTPSSKTRARALRPRTSMPSWTATLMASSTPTSPAQPPIRGSQNRNFSHILWFRKKKFLQFCSHLWYNSVCYVKAMCLLNVNAFRRAACR